MKRELELCVDVLCTMCMCIGILDCLILCIMIIDYVEIELLLDIREVVLLY